MKKNKNMMGFFSQLGSALYVPVLLFSFAGIMLSITISLTIPSLVGDLADKSGLFYKAMIILQEGAWTIFRNITLIFVVGIPIVLADKSPGRAVLAVVLSYLTYNYFIAAILTLFPGYFGIDLSSNTLGITTIAGIRTLDTGVLGSIVIAYFVTYLHNKYFQFELPEWLGVFSGTSFVVIVAFFALIPIAIATTLIWPKVQAGIAPLQEFMVTSGTVGVWTFTFLERLLIPTGLHQFLWTPFVYGPVVVPQGTALYWAENLEMFINYTGNLKDVYPQGGFTLVGSSMVFGAPGIGLAMYNTAYPENKKKTLALLIPVVLTAVVAGITEPLEFTFLFLAPKLFLIHAFLAATLVAISYSFGVVGNFGSGLLNWITNSWIPLAKNHSDMILTQIIIGLIFTCIWYFIFVYCIKTWDVKTPGREDNADELKLYSKKEYQDKILNDSGNDNSIKAKSFLVALGGKENVKKVSNCATRLRVIVKDVTIIQDDSVFKNAGAYGVVRLEDNIQIIVGLKVSQVKEEFDALIIS